MKRKMLSIALVCTMLLSITACGKKNNDTSKEDYVSQLAKDMENYEQYVTLGDYKGLTVSVDKSILEVSDEAVQSNIDTVLSNAATTTKVTEGVTKSGDSIVLDYTGLLDGVAFSGGTATDATYTVGSGRFIPDLDKGLVGLELGKEYDIPCTFPESYTDSKLAGQDVIFKVKVTEIGQKQIPEYTDEFVAANASNYDSDAKTTAEFTEFVRKTLTENAQAQYENNLATAIWEAILANTTISGYPQDEIDRLVANIETNVNNEYSQYGSAYGITDFATFLSSLYGFESEDEFKEEAENLAKSYLDQKMITTLIAKRENITVSNDEILSKGAEWASDYEYDSYEAMLKEAGDDADEVALDIGYEVLSNKVLEILRNSTTVSESAE